MEKSYTRLEPAVLADDNHEQTLVKQIYTPDTWYSSDISSIDCAQRVTSYLNLDFSPKTMTDLTPQNVDSTIKGMDNVSKCQLPVPENVETIIQLHRDLPKDMFVNRILSNYHSDEVQLKDLRHLLFSAVKALEEYPFAYGSELKRRKKPRLGESIALKLASDISILTSVLDGAPFEDMKELMSSSKPISDNLLQNDSINISVRETKDNSCRSDAEIELFRGLLSDFQADLISLKQDNDFVRNELSGEVKSLKNDLKSFKAEMRTVINELQTTVTHCQQTVENINDEQSNGVATVKSDIKQVREELQTVYEYIDEQDAKLCEKVLGAHTPKMQISKTGV